MSTCPVIWEQTTNEYRSCEKNDTLLYKNHESKYQISRTFIVRGSTPCSNKRNPDHHKPKARQNSERKTILTYLTHEKRWQGDQTIYGIRSTVLFAAYKSAGYRQYDYWWAFPFPACIVLNNLFINSCCLSYLGLVSHISLIAPGWDQEIRAKLKWVKYATYKGPRLKVLVC